MYPKNGSIIWISEPWSAIRGHIFFTITLPLITPGIITGVILDFALCLGEFGATITFVANIRDETQTLPLAPATLTQTPE